MSLENGTRHRNARFKCCRFSFKFELLTQKCCSQHGQLLPRWKYASLTLENLKKNSENLQLHAFSVKC
jgi:hypothetical protein